MRQVLPWKTSYLMCNICQLRNKLLFSLPTNIYSLHNFFFPQAIFWPWNPNLKQLVDLKVLYSSPISQVIFSVFDTNVWEIFSQETGSAYSWGFGIKKKRKNLPLMQNDHKFCDCSALFFLLCIFPFISCCAHWAISQFFPLGSLTQMACYNQEFCSGLIPDGLAFSLGQHKSVGRSLTFRVAAYNWDRLIGEEIQYIVTLIPCKSASHFVSDYKSSDYSDIFYHIV